jgi:hypothetical protein
MGRWAQRAAVTAIAVAGTMGALSAPGSAQTDRPFPPRVSVHYRVRGRTVLVAVAARAKTGAWGSVELEQQVARRSGSDETRFRWASVERLRAHYGQHDSSVDHYALHWTPNPMTAAGSQRTVLLRVVVSAGFNETTTPDRYLQLANLPWGSLMQTCSHRSFAPVSLSATDTQASWSGIGGDAADSHAAATSTLLSDGHRPAVGWQTCLNVRGQISAPAIADGLIYVLAPYQGHTRLVALNETSGAILWSQPLSGADLNVAPVLDSGEVMVEASEGVRAFNAQTGVFSWSARTGGDPVMTVASGGVAYVLLSTLQGAAAINDQTGTQIWKIGLGGNNYGLTVADGNVFIDDCGGLITAYDASTGNYDWSASLGSAPPVEGGIDVVNQAVAVGDSVLATSEGGINQDTHQEGGSGPEIASLNATTGTVQWTQPIDGTIATIAGADVILTTGSESGGNPDLALSLATGQTLWQGNTGGALSSAGDAILSLFDGSIRGSDPSTGQSLWSSPLPANSTAQAAVAGSVMVLTDQTPTGTFVTTWQ